jgi:hypothetical protein
LLRARDISVCVLSVFLISLGISTAQQDKQKPQSGSIGGIASGVAAAPIYDSQNRPITAGGFVDKGPVIFEDAAKQAGLGSWRHKMGVPEKNFIVETNGSGVCLIDFDNDGWLDIYLVNGATFDSLNGKEETPHAALFTGEAAAQLVSNGTQFSLDSWCPMEYKRVVQTVVETPTYLAIAKSIFATYGR